MTLTVPSVGSVVLANPGRADRKAGFGPRAAIVTAVSGTAAAPIVSLHVFHNDNTASGLIGVPHQAIWTAQAAAQPGWDSDAMAYWSWPAPGVNTGTN